MPLPPNDGFSLALQRQTSPAATGHCAVESRAILDTGDTGTSCVLDDFTCAPGQTIARRDAVALFEAYAKQADADTKPFAEKMVQDHQKTSSELKALVDSGKVKTKLPTALILEHQKMLDDLKAKNGKAH